MMEKKDLEQLAPIKKEIELIKAQIDNLPYKEYPQFVTDSVKGSSKSFPYVEHSILITGADTSEYFAKQTKLKEKLGRKVAELMDKVDEINDYIDSIDDSEMRLILKLRYINGLTWEQVGASMNYATVTVRKKHDAFINKNVSQNIS